jgi:hypothetical protein
LAPRLRLLNTRLSLVIAIVIVLSAGMLLAQRSTKMQPMRPASTPTPSPTPVPTPLRKDLGPITKTLTPTNFVTDSKQSMKKGAELFVTGDANMPLPPANALYVGYLHDTNGKDNLGTGYEARNETYRGGLRFEVPKIFGRYVKQATLNLRIYKTHIRGVHSNPDYYNATKSCAVRITTAKSRWYAQGDMNGSLVDIGDPSVGIIPSGTQDLHINVTALAQAWSLHPETNFGMVLMGENEDMKAYTETICQTQFVHAGDGAPTLVVTY